MKKYFPQKDLSKLAKKLERLLILRDSITRFINEFLDWFVKLYLFQKNLENHIGAILTFLHHYNECIQVQF